MKPAWWMLFGLGSFLHAGIPAFQPKLYWRYACASCHGVDGTGRLSGGLRLPGTNLADRKWQVDRSDTDLVRSILEGKGAMPAFRARLTEEEVRRLVREVIRPASKKK